MKKWGKSVKLNKKRKNEILIKYKNEENSIKTIKA